MSDTRTTPTTGETNPNAHVSDILAQVTVAGSHALDSVKAAITTGDVRDQLAGMGLTLDGLVKFLDTVDLNEIDPDSLLPAMHEVCKLTDRDRDAAIDLLQLALRNAVNSIKARIAAKAAHIKLAQKSEAKAKAEDVFGAAPSLMGEVNAQLQDIGCQSITAKK